jgi:hypothetical protein
MWQESEDGIGDLLRCELPQLAKGSLAEPEPVNVDWWAKNRILISPNPLGREDLFAIASAARESGDDAHLLQLFWHMLAWGVMGNFRNAPRIVRAAKDDAGRTHLLAALRPAAAASYQGNIDDAYRAFLNHKISRLDYAFFTKFLYFTGDRSSGGARCLILDDRVDTALFTITGHSYLPEGARRAKAYAQYCGDVYRWSAAYGVEPDRIEWRLYRFGQLTERRWQWLSAEVSLYPRGSDTRDFRRDCRTCGEPSCHYLLAWPIYR